MKLHQSDDKIIVTKLRQMSEAPDDYVWYCHDGNFIEAISVNDSVITVDGAKYNKKILSGWIPRPVFDPKNTQPNKAELYEKLRKLNPREFAELHERNLLGECSFDDLVSMLP